MSSLTFAALGAPAPVAEQLASRGIVHPTPIQALALPDALDGRDVSGRAPTGSGKTIAFGIPLVARLGRGSSRRPKGLVLVPTRELAAQVANELIELGSSRGLKTLAVYGGVGFEPQIRALRRGVDVVVGCPGRLADLVNRKDIVLDDVEMVVVDEADRMADMGFLPEVRRLLDRVRADRQTLLFSATLDGDVGVLVRRYQRSPVVHEIVEDAARERDTTHHFWAVDRVERIRVLTELVGARWPAIVFCRTKHGADRLVTQLGRGGVTAGAIHGNRSQGQRDRALASFASGKLQVLVATDVAARGIHVDDVDAVVHYDPPATEKDYVHRSGRTGRAGRAGLVVSLVQPDQRGHVSAQQRVLGRDARMGKPNMTELKTPVAAGPKSRSNRKPLTVRQIAEQRTRPNRRRRRR
jgi:superfamily II DNA/RNA helicase